MAYFVISVRILCFFGMYSTDSVVICTDNVGICINHVAICTDNDAISRIGQEVQEFVFGIVEVFLLYRRKKISKIVQEKREIVYRSSGEIIVSLHREIQ